MKFGYLEGSHNPRSWGLTSSPWLWSPLTSARDDPPAAHLHLLNPSHGWNFSNSRRRLHSADWPNQHLTFQAFALQWLWDPHQEPNSCPGAPLESSRTLNDMMILIYLHEFPWFLWVFMSVNIPVPWILWGCEKLGHLRLFKNALRKSDPKIFSQKVGERMLMNPMVRIQSKRSHKKIQESADCWECDIRPPSEISGLFRFSG